MGLLRRIKDKILKKLYSTSNKDLLNPTWENYYWGINNKEIVIWGANAMTQQHITAHREKVQFIVDKNPQNWTSNFSGIPVVEPNVVCEMNRNTTAVIILSDIEKAATFLRSKGFKYFYAPAIMNKRKRLLVWFRNRKKDLKAFASGVKKFGAGVKKCIKAILLSPYTLIFDKIVSPEICGSIATLAYTFGNSEAKKATWKQFEKAANGKNLVLFGYCRATEIFIASSKDKYKIKACYTFEEKWFGKELMGSPIKSPVDFEFDPETDVALVAYSNGCQAAAAIDFLTENGVNKYFSWSALEIKRFRNAFFKPMYRLKRSISMLKRKNGIIRNFITYPIKCFLRVCRIPPFYNRKTYKELLAYKNKFKGKRCFIVCTGPSLKVEDVERLSNEITFSVNSIHTIFSKTKWRPTFYCACDPNCLKVQRKKAKLDFDNWCVERAFLSDYYKKEVDALKPKRVQYIPVNYLDHFCKGEKNTLKYSKNLLFCSYNALTVTNMCINIAHYMGFSEIYLLGADCSYDPKQSYFDGSRNEFAPSPWICASVQRLMIEGYTFVKKKMDKYGVKVNNATRGGKLEVFPRVNFDTLFPYENQEYDYELMPDGSRNPITVSVNVITYGHEAYIRRTLDSILAQKTKFRIEVNVGEDKSPDNTREILLEYQEKYPDIFNMKLREENLGVTKNAYDLFMNAKGKYIAYIEGDDMWSDPYKLQKQVDFLEYHKEYIACTAAVDTIDENDEITHVEQYWDCRKTLYTYKDIDGFGLPSLNNSMLHRNIFLNSSIDYSIYLKDPIVGDQQTLAFVACQGDIFRMPEKMLLYRRLKSKKKKSATATCFADKYQFFHLFWLYYNLTKFAKDTFGIKLHYTAFRKAIEQCIIALYKYPDKAHFKEFLKMFAVYSNKPEFIAVAIRALWRGFIKKLSQHKGEAKERWLKRNPNKNLLKNSVFDTIEYETIPKQIAVSADDSAVSDDGSVDLDIADLSEQIKLPDGWRSYKLPGEYPAFYASENGIILDSSDGTTRIRQAINTPDLAGKWVTFSVNIVFGFEGTLRLWCFNDRGEAFKNIEFENPNGGKILYASWKIPGNCHRPAFQLMIDSGEQVEVRYLKVELGKRATGIDKAQ